MFKVNDKVIVIDRIESSFEAATVGIISEVEKCQILFRTKYLVKFENGDDGWFHEYELKELNV